MRPLLTPEEMARADRVAIEGGIPVEVLMDRAGRAVARTAIGLAGGRYGKRAVVVCGKGNNGGDGFVAARLLARAGLGVTCLATFDVDQARGAPRHHLDLLAREGVPVEGFSEARLLDADVVVDALFGTGFKGPATGEAARAITAINACGAPVVAVDIPSGVDGTSGAADGPCVNARATVAMGAEKVGTAVTPGALKAGRVEVADIGIEVSSATVWLVEKDDVARALPRRKPDAHKRSTGWVALLVGSRAMTGAAVLCARGALRAGAGYVTVGTTSAVKEAVNAAVPEALCEALTEGDALGPDALTSFQEALDRVGAVGLGCGIGQGDGQRALVDEVLAKAAAPVVVDADGLNALAGRSQALEARSEATVITPHPGELARLLDANTADIQSSRLASAQAAAQRFSTVVLLKGYRTVVAEPGGGAVVIPVGGAELATAGTGDVLTGAVSAFAAGGLEAFQAAWAAAYVHGLAGSVAGAEVGPHGVVATDVAEALPVAIDLVLEPTLGPDAEL